MQTFRYTALTHDGTETKGVIQATDEFEAVEKIRVNCPVVTKIAPVKKTKRLLSMEIGGNRVSHRNIALMCSQFAIILRAGTGVSRAMEMISQQTQDKRLKKMLSESAVDVAEGSGIADSMGKNGPQLPITFIETVRAGEKSGTLVKSFGAMEAYFTRTHRTSQRLKRAMTYPIFVITIAIIVLVIVMAKLVPVLAETFKGLGGQMPTMTKIMIRNSEFFGKYWPLIVCAILVLIASIKLWKMTPRGGEVFSRMCLKLPIIGKINLLNGASEFANTMSVLLSAGMGLDDCIEITAKAMTNRCLGREVGQMTSQLQEGKSLGECVKKCDFFPDTLKDMCSIGEETGDLEQTLKTTGEYFDNEANHVTTQALNRLEPTILVLLGMFTGFIVVSIYLPIFTMYNYM